MKKFPSIIQIAGLTVLTTGVCLFSVALGTITAGIAIIVVGVALEIGRSE